MAEIISTSEGATYYFEEAIKAFGPEGMGEGDSRQKEDSHLIASW